LHTQRRILWTALLALAVGATMLHYRIHPPKGGTTSLLANVFAWTDLVLVSTLFLSKRTAVWGLLLNSFLAFLGVILMADFSLHATLHGVTKAKPTEQFIAWLLETTLPDIAVVVGDFLVGLALYNSIMGVPASRIQGKEVGGIHYANARTGRALDVIPEPRI
jgi:hypothetical protein